MMSPWVTTWMVFTSPALMTIFIFLIVNLNQNEDGLRTPKGGQRQLFVLLGYREVVMVEDIEEEVIMEEYILEDSLMDMEDMRKEAQNNMQTGGRHHMKLVSITLLSLTMLTEMPIDGRKPLQPRLRIVLNLINLVMLFYSAFSLPAFQFYFDPKRQRF